MLAKLAPLAEILEDTKDGDWGEETPRPSHAPYRVICGTDFDAVRYGDLSSVPSGPTLSSPRLSPRCATRSCPSCSRARSARRTPRNSWRLPYERESTGPR